jgi:excinuclease ABC subunit C
MLEIIDKLFPLRKCKRAYLQAKKGNGPCMYYHIGRCKAPCRGMISIEEYNQHVEQVQRLLAGETGPLMVDLTEKMHEAAKALQFEWAAQLRNAIRAIEALAGEDSAVVDFDPEGRDYLAWAAEGVLATFTVFSMRGGKMTGRELYRTRSAADEAESLEQFITTYYDPSRPPPLKIYVQNIITQRGIEPLVRDPEDAEEKNGSMRLCVKNLAENFGYEPEVVTPTEKHHSAILAMARQNAQEDLRKRLKERGAGPALDELARILHLSGRPERIEGFDISHLDGKHPVASLVSFKNGIPDKKNYRHFKLRSVIGMVDDFTAMREVVQRRYSRLIREGKELPDLVLIDGGSGQVNAAKGVLEQLGLDIGIVGLAKRNEELWLPNAKGPLVLSRRSEALKVLQYIRDETHRFATGHNQRLRAKDLSFPAIESVEGIGKRRAAAIMKAYITIEAIAAADPAELSERCLISQASAKAACAAARLALEDRKAHQQRLMPGRGKYAGKGIAETLAAEAAEPAAPDYE